jgi:hypothetical protein
MHSLHALLQLLQQLAHNTVVDTLWLQNHADAQQMHDLLLSFANLQRSAM